MASSHTRLILRQAKLKEVTVGAQTILARGSALEEEFVSHRVKLKQCLEVLEKEIFHFLSVSQDIDISEITQDQLTAEDTLNELETAWQLNKNQTDVTTKAKLPELGLPTYEGDKLKWSEFWDRFVANVDKRELAESEKLLYLMGCLKGPALETISGLTATNANYSIAVETLKKRFGSSSILIDAHYTALTNLPKADQTSTSCRSVLDNIERNLRVLEKLGEPVSGNHLRTQVLSKFPATVIHDHHLAGGKDDLDSIRTSLNRIITAMEKSDALMTHEETIKPGPSTTEALQIRVEARPQDSRKRKQTRDNEAPPAKKPKRPCLFCNAKGHLSADCRRFQTLEARQKQLKGRCLHCLRRNHKTTLCRRKISCYHCKGDHLMVFCPVRSGESVIAGAAHTTLSCANTNGYTYLQTAVGTLQNPQTNKNKLARILLDCGSQRSYITQQAATMLNLPTLQEDCLLIYTFGASKPQKITSPTAIVNINTKRGISKQITVNIVPKITDRVPVAFSKYDGVDILADDDTAGETVDLLIGNDCYSAILRENKVQIADNLYLLDTDFGWVLSGNITPAEVNNALSVVTYCQCHVPSCPYFTEPDLPLRNIDVQFLWSLESIGITDSPKATRQEEAVRHFNDTVQHQDGRYLVKWPWIQYPPDLPSNFGLALGRLRSTLKRLDKAGLDEYESILKEQLELGIIEVVNQDDIDDSDHPLHYLPHHMVKQKGKKGRIVYDASAKTTGQKSLNECLYSGPSMLEDLTALLLKFRTKRIGLIADVEKAFLQVALQKDDRDVTRFLWVKDINKEATEENLVHLRFCRVPFGVISSPFLLTATIQHHMTQSNEELVQTVAHKCYVDNLVTGANSAQEATQIYSQTRSSFEQLSMNIRDWTSNNKEFMNTIPETHKADQCNHVKVLGLYWSLSKDALKLNITQNHGTTDKPVNTKRKVLQALARVYDPCGFVCPLILPMKLIFQNICEIKVKWDAELPADLILSIHRAIQNLKIIADIEIPRYIGTDTSKGDLTYQLHCFTDASKNAYSAVVYIKVISQERSSISFLMAKSHVSQTKDKDDLKIPKLELLGFLIGSRLLKYIRNNLELEIAKEYLWSDSMVVLCWMKSNKLLPPFVANRVNEIKRNHPNTEMCYIHTKSNPADIATRPELFEEKMDLWYNGPEFLIGHESTWPEDRLYNLLSFGEVPGDGLGERSPEMPIEGSDGGPDDPLEPDDGPHCLEGDSQGSRGRSEPTEFGEGHSGEPMELDSSDSQLKELQRKHFPEEVEGKRTHLAKNLDLFLDVGGVLRCRGRMANTTWAYDKKYPILLPKNCQFTDKIIKDTHESNYHVGPSHTLNSIRERYWIPQGKPQVQKVLKRCPQCIKHGGGPYRLPDTPALPPERVNYDKPYTYTGVDYFGPLLVSSPSGREKRWVALFTCLTIRAIHLEIVKDLSAEECLLALRRFAATRGIPQRMYSDNATCFKLVSEVVQEPYCIENKIQWRFIPQLAPWHGAFYERLIALVKHCLKRTLEKHLLNDNKLLTVMKEVEAVLNTRPLTRVGTEVEHVLRPADFLSLGGCLTAKPSIAEAPTDSTAIKSDLIESWKRGLRIIEEFKKMFIGQYLTSLRERYNHAPKQPRVKSHRKPQVGDLVQIKSDLKNRNQWKVGKIDTLIEGRDGEHRVAKVKVNDSTLIRSIGHLYPLEIEDERPEAEDAPAEQTEMIERDLSDGNTPVALDDQPDFEMDTPADRTETSNPEVSTHEEQHEDREIVRSKRAAAVRARDKILEWTRNLLALLH